MKVYILVLMMVLCNLSAVVAQLNKVDKQFILSKSSLNTIEDSNVLLEYNVLIYISDQTVSFYHTYPCQFQLIYEVDPGISTENRQTYKTLDGVTIFTLDKNMNVFHVRKFDTTIEGDGILLMPWLFYMRLKYL